MLTVNLPRLVILFLALPLIFAGCSGGGSSSKKAVVDTGGSGGTGGTGSGGSTGGTKPDIVINAKSRSACINTTKVDSDGAIDIPEDNACVIVKNDKAIMYGVLGQTTPDLIRTLHSKYPDVKIIVMQDVPGSEDDTANLEASKLLRQYGYRTHVPKDGVIASGGTDMFTAGKLRTIEIGAKLGVHSWSGIDENGNEVGGDKLPKSSPEHKPYLDFYTLMGIPTDFYWFTLTAAPASDIHYMTIEEMKKYKLLTSDPSSKALARSFTGTYKMSEVSKQGINQVTLSGENNSNIIGNDKDNTLSGNAGTNTLDGGEGTDTVVFAGKYDEYAIDKSGAEIIVQDSVVNRDGVNRLINIEFLKFSDKTLSVDTI